MTHLLWALTTLASAAPAERPADMTVHTADAHRFFDALEAHETGMPLRRALRRHYKRPGSEGLAEAWKINIGTVGKLAGQVRVALPYYRALESQLDALEAERPEILQVHERLEALLPEAVHPDVFVVVGRLNSAGTLSDQGLFISLEMFGRDAGVAFREGSWLARVMKPIDDLDAIVAHELAHYQQTQQPKTVLEHCLVEGIADVVAEVIAGRHTNPSVYRFGQAHHDAIAARFAAEQHQLGRGRWMYRDPGVDDWPQDLGYYMGHHLAYPVFAAHDNPSDGLRALLTWTDATVFVTPSPEPTHTKTTPPPLSPEAQTQ